MLLFYLLLFFPTFGGTDLVTVLVDNVALLIDRLALKLFGIALGMNRLVSLTSGWAQCERFLPQQDVQLPFLNCQ